MPLIGPVLGSLINTQFAAQGFTGVKQFQLATALGNGIIFHIQFVNFYQGTAIGVGTGAGVGTGFINPGTVAAPLVTSQIILGLTAQGYTGVKMPQLAAAIGNAFSAHIITGIVQTTTTPVAVGSGFGKILGVTGPGCGAQIFSMMAAQGFTGTKMLQLAQGVGLGIANIMNAAVVQTVIAGGGFPPTPASSPEFGKLI